MAILVNVTYLFEDADSDTPPKVVKINSLGSGQATYPEIRPGKEYTIRRGGPFTHYIVVEGVKRVRVIVMRSPTIGVKYHELVLVQNLTPEGPTSPTTFWISPEDLEEIPPVAQNNLNKPAVPPPQAEEDPEDGSHPAGYGPHV